jgi:hypothetical protein
MKRTVYVVLVYMLLSCNPGGPDKTTLQLQIDSIQKKLDKSYKPGLGEFMSGIQVHHAKLWFAGGSGNWELADFEIKEIQEAIEDIQTYCTDRPETALIPMINPVLDSMNLSIGNRDIQGFKSSFILLTNACNSCHKATKHAFNVIQVPVTPPFTNQSFQKPKT